MKLIQLHNPTDKDILDYRIEEVEFDQNGNIMLDQYGVSKKTGKTLEWTLKAGETLKFPEYVAKYLKGIYDFLEVGEEETQGEPTVAPEVTATPVEGSIICKFCGKSMRGAKGLGLHMAHEHPEELMKGAMIR